MRLACNEYKILVASRITGWTEGLRSPDRGPHGVALARAHSPVSNFGAAVDAIVNGDRATLEKLQHNHPELAHERSTRDHGHGPFRGLDAPLARGPV